MPPAFENVIDGRSSAYEQGTFKFMTRVTFKFTARPEAPSGLQPVTFKFTARSEAPTSLLPDQRHLQV